MRFQPPPVFILPCFSSSIGCSSRSVPPSRADIAPSACKHQMSEGGYGTMAHSARLERWRAPVGALTSRGLNNPRLSLSRTGTKGNLPWTSVSTRIQWIKRYLARGCTQRTAVASSSAATALNVILHDLPQTRESLATSFPRSPRHMSVVMPGWSGSCFSYPCKQVPRKLSKRTTVGSSLTRILSVFGTSTPIAPISSAGQRRLSRPASSNPDRPPSLMRQWERIRARAPDQRPTRAPPASRYPRLFGALPGQ